MHPAVSDHLAQAHMADLRRRAQTNRLAWSARTDRRARSDQGGRAGPGWSALRRRVLGARSTCPVPGTPPLTSTRHSGTGAGSTFSKLAVVMRPVRAVGRLAGIRAGWSPSR
jgi:hypothetical protein